MRVRVIFNLNNKGVILPFHHQHLIAKMIADVLKESGKFTTDLDTVLSSINFSGIKGQTKVGKSGLHYCSNKVTIVLSSFSESCMSRVIQELFKKKYVLVGKLNITPEKVEKEVYQEVQGQMKYLCISPVIFSSTGVDVADSLDLYSDSLSDLLYDSTMAKVERSGMFSYDQIASFYNFQIVVDKKYIQKARSAGKKISRLYKISENGVKKEYRGYTFPFTLYADAKIQEFILNCGFGEFTSKGFGMLDLVDKKSIIQEVNIDEKILSLVSR